LARIESYEYTQLFSKPSIAMLNIMKFKHSALLATYSPSVIAKNPSKKELFFSDLKKIKEYL